MKAPKVGKLLKKRDGNLPIIAPTQPEAARSMRRRRLRTPHVILINHKDRKVITQGIHQQTGRSTTYVRGPMPAAGAAFVSGVN